MDHSYLNQSAPPAALVLFALPLIGMLLQGVFIRILLLVALALPREGWARYQVLHERLNSVSFFFMFGGFVGVVFFPKPFLIALFVICVFAFILFLRINTRELERLC